MRELLTLLFTCISIAAGQLVLKQTVGSGSSITISTTRYCPGVYVLWIISGNEKEAHKIIL